jgi:hypothetical protein
MRFLMFLISFHSLVVDLVIALYEQCMYYPLRKFTTKMNSVKLNLEGRMWGTFLCKEAIK